MMKKLAIAAALAAATSSAAIAATATMDASVTVIRPVEIQNVVPVNFGAVARPVNAGQTAEFTIAADGTPSVSVAQAGASFAGVAPRSAGSFRLIGQEAYTVNISAVASSANADTGLGLKDATLRTAGGIDKTAAGDTQAMPAGDQMDFSVGATMTIDSTAVSGARKAGEVALTANY